MFSLDGGIAGTKSISNINVNVNTVNNNGALKSNSFKGNILGFKWFFLIMFFIINYLFLSMNSSITPIISEMIEKLIEKEYRLNV